MSCQKSVCVELCSHIDLQYVVTVASINCNMVMPINTKVLRLEFCIYCSRAICHVVHTLI